MKKITVNVNPAYDIYVGAGILEKCGEIIAPLTSGKKVVIVTDDIVDKLYADTVKKSLKGAGFTTKRYVFKNGEASKNHDTLIELYDALSEWEITRKDIIIALGGGVVGDLTGFCAATYLRGIDYVQIPTTLLAQTDSSVGGKTAVDIKGGKNLVGAFKQPLCVIADTDTLKTLPQDIFEDGMGEVIKYGMIKSKTLFDDVKNKDINVILEDVITECINIKREVVEIDEFDTGLRMILNYGHTLGHSIEKYYNFTGIFHGKAVAIGMCLIARICEKCGLSSGEVTNSLVECLEKYNLPTKTDVPVAELLKGCLSDKKRESELINIIICKEIGQSEIMKMEITKFAEMLEGK